MKKLVSLAIALALLNLGCVTVRGVDRKTLIEDVVTAHNVGCTTGLWEKARHCGPEVPGCQSDIRTRCKRLSDQYREYVEKEVYK